MYSENFFFIFASKNFFINVSQNGPCFCKKFARKKFFRVSKIFFIDIRHIYLFSF